MRDIKINTEIAERVTLTDSNENRHNDLTPEIVAFLLSGGECIVKGKIPIYPHPRETRCPICQLKFEHIPELGYVCRPHFTRPNRYRIYVKGELIYNDEKGGTLDSYKRANELLHQITREIKDHTFEISRYVKCEQKKFYIVNLIKDYQTYKLSDVAPSNKATFKHDCALAADYFKTLDVRDLRKKQLTDYLTDRLRVVYANCKTQHNKMRSFMAFLSWCRDNEIIPNVPPIPEIEWEEKEAECVDQDVRIAIFEAVPFRHKPLFACILLQTLRPGEARALRCKDILLDKKMIYVHATFSKNTYQEKRKGRKSKAYKQPIHPEMLEYFTLRRLSGADEDYVFTAPKTGTAYTQDRYLDVWHAVRKKLELPAGLKLYEAGKHSTVTLLKAQGASDNTLMKLFGLSNVATLRKYDHSTEDNSEVVAGLTLKKEIK